jgi:hypothetical protein
MSKFIALVGAALFSTAVYASCVTNTYMMDGRTVICTTCCYMGNCTTTCY